MAGPWRILDSIKRLLFSNLRLDAPIKANLAGVNRKWLDRIDHAHRGGLPKRGRPKKSSVDPDFDRLADALLVRAERAIAELELNDRQRRYLIRVLRSRLRSMATLADRRSSPRKP